MLGVTGGTRVKMTPQETMFPAEVHVPMSGTAQNLHKALIVDTPTLKKKGVRGNGVGGTARPVEAPPSETVAGQKKFAGRGSTGWFALTAVVKMFGLAATIQEFLKNY